MVGNSFMGRAENDRIDSFAARMNYDVNTVTLWSQNKIKSEIVIINYGGYHDGFSRSPCYA